jgi:hypothetical protein
LVGDARGGERDVARLGGAGRFDKYKFTYYSSLGVTEFCADMYLGRRGWGERDLGLGSELMCRKSEKDVLVKQLWYLTCVNRRSDLYI